MATATLPLVAALVAASPAPETRPWRSDPLFRQIQARLGVVDMETAVRLGEGALRGNAEGLYGWSISQEGYR